MPPEAATIDPPAADTDLREDPDGGAYGGLPGATAAPQDDSSPSAPESSPPPETENDAPPVQEATPADDSSPDAATKPEGDTAPNPFEVVRKDAPATLDDVMALLQGDGRDRPQQKHFAAMTAKFEEARAALQAEIDELRSSTPETPDGYDPDWQAKLQAAQDAASGIDDLTKERDDLRHRVSQFDISTDPEFEQKYSTAEVDSEIEGIASALQIDPSRLDALRSATGADRWTALGKLQGSPALISQLSDRLKSRDAIVVERDEALRRPEETRRQISEQKARNAALRSQQEAEEQARIAAASLRDTVASRAESDPHLYGTEDGQRITEEVIARFGEAAPTPGEIVEGQFALREAQVYRNLSTELAGEVRRLQRILGTTADPGSMGGPGPATGDTPAPGQTDPDGGIFGTLG